MITTGTAAALLLGLSLGFGSWSYMMPHQDPTGTLLLVNKQYKAPTVPLALARPEVHPMNGDVAKNTYMRPEAAAALEEMFAAAAAEGINLYTVSGYRSYATQKAIFSRKSRERGEKVANQTSAKAGQSEHQTGLAMDFEGESMLGQGLRKEIGESPEGIWVAEHCWEYGFILRYARGMTKITGYAYEPWHVRYVGKETSRRIHELGDIPYETYMQRLRTERIEWMEAQGNE